MLLDNKDRIYKQRCDKETRTLESEWVDSRLASRVIPLRYSTALWQRQRQRRP
jgi:hypothetical protein